MQITKRALFMRNLQNQTPNSVVLFQQMSWEQLHPHETNGIFRKRLFNQLFQPAYQNQTDAFPEIDH